MEIYMRMAFWDPTNFHALIFLLLLLTKIDLLGSMNISFNNNKQQQQGYN